MSFGARLRDLREAAGLTQEELAERANLSVNAVAALERGRRRRPYPNTIRALAEALGLSDQERVALAKAIQPSDRALAPSPEHHPVSSLPVSLTDLVGRERDVDTLAGWLRGAELRLVTLTGPGGVGKTRLASQIAADLAEEFPDGVVFVSLAPLAEPALVVPAIAAAVGLREQVGQDLDVALRGFLRTRRMLLVLDNFEHVLTAAPDVAEFLAGCPGLRVLATSRARLHLRGEREYLVEPLGAP